MKQVETLRRWASDEGIITEVCGLHDAPDVWSPPEQELGVFGISTRDRAILGLLPYGPEELAIVTLAHELGHVLAGRQVGREYWAKPGRVQNFLEECDAWERGLVILGELGLHVTPEACRWAIRCLNQYRRDVNLPLQPIELWFQAGCLES
jgi:hypothetical protein